MTWFLFMFVTAPMAGVLFRAAARRQRAGQPHACPSCQIDHPAFAQYCRRCGRRLL